jgi:hypothetical protein
MQNNVAKDLFMESEHDELKEKFTIFYKQDDIVEAMSDVSNNQISKIDISQLPRNNNLPLI